jgi:hypothetical protein
MPWSPATVKDMGANALTMTTSQGRQRVMFEMNSPSSSGLTLNKTTGRKHVPSWSDISEDKISCAQSTTSSVEICVKK